MRHCGRWQRLADQIRRLETAAATLEALRPQVEAGAPWPLADAYGVEPEANWGPPEVLAHVEEYLRYWMGEIERVLERRWRDAATPFGRIATDDPSGSEIIGRDRTLPLREMFARIDGDATRIAKRLAELSEAEATRRGVIRPAAR